MKTYTGQLKRTRQAARGRPWPTFYVCHDEESDEGPLDEGRLEKAYGDEWDKHRDNLAGDFDAFQEGLEMRLFGPAVDGLCEREGPVGRLVSDSGIEHGFPGTLPKHDKGCRYDIAVIFCGLVSVGGLGRRRSRKRLRM